MTLIPLMIRHSLNLEITYSIFELLWWLRWSSSPLPVTSKYWYCCYHLGSYYVCWSSLVHLNLSVLQYLKTALLLLEFLFSRLNYLCSLNVFIKWGQVFSQSWWPFSKLAICLPRASLFCKAPPEYRAM